MTDKEQIIINGKGCRHKTWDAECSLTGDHHGDNMKPCKFIDEKSCHYKQLVRKTQVIDEIEEVIKPYQEQIELDALSLPSAIESILERKTQECEELKEKLYQIEDVVKPINEQLPEDSVIRQIMLILNDCNKLEPSRYHKALEEIEEYTKNFKEVDLFEDIKDIINKAKGEGNE